MTYATVIQSIRQLVSPRAARRLTSQQAAGGSGGDTVFDQYAEFCLADYSIYCPRVIITDAVHDGTGFVITPWTEGLSRVIGVESPVDQSPPRYLSGMYYRVATDGNNVTRVIADGYAAGSEVRIEHAAIHILQSAVEGGQAEVVTIPDAHAKRFAHLVASVMYQALADEMAENVDPTVAADTASLQAIREQYDAIATRHFEQFARMAGIDPEKRRPAVAYGLAHAPAQTIRMRRNWA